MPGRLTQPIATVGSTMRCPGALVTRTKPAGADLLVSDPVVVFEVLSPSSGRVDRILKVREYAAVPSIRRLARIGRRQGPSSGF